MKKQILLLAFFGLGVATASAQTINNIDFYVSGENIIVTYDFVGTKTNQRFEVQLYVRFDNGSWRALSYVSGDVGRNQSGGYSKRINWRALVEYSEIQSNLSFKIKATCTSSCVDVDEEMVFVEGGTFQMGSNNGGSDEKPVHSVTVSSFYISKYEVTQKQWREVMGTNPSHFKNCDNCPVEQVSWNDIQDFIQKLNQRTGKKHRLPTEAEWEYAARGGKKSRGYKYAGSNNINEVAWYGYEKSGKKTHPVGQKQPNELGLYDMAGNVWEWCSDWYDSEYYTNSPSTNPKGPSSGSSRVYRGGGWYYGARGCRVAYRSYYNPTLRYSGIGFRLVFVP